MDCERVFVVWLGQAISPEFMTQVCLRLRVRAYKGSSPSCSAQAAPSVYC